MASASNFRTSLHCNKVIDFGNVLANISLGEMISQGRDTFPYKVMRINQGLVYSVGNNARKLNKICSGNFYPFSWSQSWNTFLLADEVIRFQFSPNIFKIVYTDHLKAHFS